MISAGQKVTVAPKRALSSHALGVLDDLAGAPLPGNQVNPGVARRLFQDGLVEYCDLPSPYKSHAGRDITHLRITAGGRACLEASRLSREQIIFLALLAGDLPWLFEWLSEERGKPVSARGGPDSYAFFRIQSQGGASVVTLKEFNQLKSRGYFDESFSITERGLAVLASGQGRMERRAL